MTTSAVILLAGGLASRLGSDKALYSVAGKPLIRHITDRISGLSDEFWVVVARNASTGEYSKVLPSSTRIINDIPGGKSPLIGIVTGLRAASSQYAIVLSCDIPFVNRRVIQLLLRRASGAEAAIPRSKAGHLEPLQAVYLRDSMLREAEKALAEKRLSPIAAISRLTRVIYVSIEDEIRTIDPELRTFFNMNTREDVERAEVIFKDGQEKRSVEDVHRRSGNEKTGKDGALLNYRVTTWIWQSPARVALPRSISEARTDTDL
jgi:molybdopterin-guanine dinucleotide biosynthesis protein A